MEKQYLVVSDNLFTFIKRNWLILFNVPNSGWYRLFAQVKVKGHEVFGRFDLYLE